MSQDPVTLSSRNISIFLYFNLGEWTVRDFFHASVTASTLLQYLDIIIITLFCQSLQNKQTQIIHVTGRQKN